MTPEERFANERKAFRKFLENKNRGECIALMCEIAERVDEIEKGTLLGTIQFN